MLFCDVVESTPLSQRLDAEEFDDLMLAFQRLVTETIAWLGGSVGGYAGDGVAAWFGWPTAHEDATALAVQASLEILAGLDDLNDTVEQRHGLRLAAGRGERGPGGGAHRPIRRTRLRRDAQRRRQARVVRQARHARDERGGTGPRGDGFETVDLGSHPLKGVAQPVGIFRVDALRTTDDAAPAFAAPMVGRDDELGRLTEAWGDVRAGRRRTVVIAGEPGVGKSRLLACFRATLEDQPHRWLALRCSPLRINTAFHPVAEMVRTSAGIRFTDEPDEQRRLIRAVLPADQAGAELSIAALLGLETEGLPGPEQFRRELMEALHCWLAELATQAPVVVAAEDLHWSDPSTLELMRLLQARLAEAPVLLVVTRRLEGEPGLARDVDLLLDRLGPEQARALARSLAAARGMDAELADRVAERSDGVPLFVEELVAGADQDDGSGLPTSLQSSLLARLDRLGSARDVAQVASVLGRSFPERLLAAATELPPDRLGGELRRLTAAGILEDSTSIDGRRYEFRHALIRDGA